MTSVSHVSGATQVLALLKIGGVSPRLFDILIQQFGSPAEILAADVSELRKRSGVSAIAARQIESASKRLAEIDAYRCGLNNRGIQIITRFDDNYGRLLSELNDPPPLLYVRGTLPSPEEKSVTLIGTRNSTAEGITLTTRLARQFAAEHVQVVSSLNGGNDSAAHLGARGAGSRSFAVVESGLDTLDPQSQVPLAIDIAQTGGVISEFSPEAAASDKALEATDRLLVGITQATVITELYHDSRREYDILTFCNEIGKMVFVVVDDTLGPLADAESVKHAAACGAILLHGPQQAGDIARSLV